MPYIMKQLQPVQRVDVIWEVYRQNSIKVATRERRGCGTRRRVTPSSQIPRNWKSFLRVNENKTQLFHFLATILSCRRKGTMQHIRGENFKLAKMGWYVRLYPRRSGYTYHTSSAYCFAVWIPQSHDKKHQHRCRRSCSFKNARH